MVPTAVAAAAAASKRLRRRRHEPRKYVYGRRKSARDRYASYNIARARRRKGVGGEMGTGNGGTVTPRGRQKDAENATGLSVGRRTVRAARNGGKDGARDDPYRTPPRNDRGKNQREQK